MAKDEYIDALPKGFGPTDEELFAEVVGRGQDKFRKEANDQLALANDRSHHPEDGMYARERGEELIEFVAELLEMAEAARRQDKEYSDRFWKDQRNQMLAGATHDLFTYAVKIRRPGTRGMLFEMVADIAEAAFRIGQWVETAPSARKKVIDDGNADRYRRGGRTRAEQRTAESDQWQALAKQKAEEMRAPNPSCPHHAITDAVIASWPSNLKRRAWSTVDDYLRKKVLSKRGVQTQKSGETEELF